MEAIVTKTTFGTSVCLKFREGDREVSLVLDDSIGAMKTCRRGSLALYEGGDATVTADVFPEAPNGFLSRPTEGDIALAMAWLMGWRRS